jgi:hypothetical protein
MLQVDALFKEIDEGEYGREQLQTVLDFWSLFTRDQLVAEAGQGALASMPPSELWGRVAPSVLQNRLDRIAATKRLLHHNSNSRLAIEELTLHF